MFIEEMFASRHFSIKEAIYVPILVVYIAVFMCSKLIMAVI